MCPPWSRRDVIKGFVAASAAWIPSALSGTRGGEDASQSLVEVQITPITLHTFRLSLLPLNSGSPIPSDGSLAQDSWGTPVARLRSDTGRQIEIGNSRLTITFNP